MFILSTTLYVMHGKRIKCPLQITCNYYVIIKLKAYLMEQYGFNNAVMSSRLACIGLIITEAIK